MESLYFLDFDAPTPRISRGFATPQTTHIASFEARKSGYTPKKSDGNDGCEEKDKKQTRVCWFYQAVNKKIGLRPYDPKTFKPVGKALPRGSYVPTKEQLKLAKTMMKPIAFVIPFYLFVDKKGCEPCSAKQKTELANILKKIGAPTPTLDKITDTYEGLHYPGLGKWQFPEK